MQKFKKSAWKYIGDYDTWDDASDNVLGYDLPKIIAKVFAATEKVLAGDAIYERDSMLFYTPECNWNIWFASYRIAQKKGLLHVLDFGGALGSVYRQHAQLLTPTIQDISWNIVEQKSFLEVAEKLNCETELHFHNTIEDVFMNCDIDVVLFSSVLQYINDYENIFEKVKHVNYIIVDRHPEFCDKDEARFTVQKLMEPIYNASCHLKIFGKKELEKLFLSKYTILENWQYYSDIKQFFKSKDGKRHEPNWNVVGKQKY